jgi:hypothetical protein
MKERIHKACVFLGLGIVPMKDEDISQQAVFQAYHLTPAGA